MDITPEKYTPERAAFAKEVIGSFIANLADNMFGYGCRLWGELEIARLEAESPEEYTPEQIELAKQVISDLTADFADNMSGYGCRLWGEQQMAKLGKIINPHDIL